MITGGSGVNDCPYSGYVHWVYEVDITTTSKRHGGSNQQVKRNTIKVAPLRDPKYATIPSTPFSTTAVVADEMMLDIADRQQITSWFGEHGEVMNVGDAVGTSLSALEIMMVLSAAQMMGMFRASICKAELTN